MGVFGGMTFRQTIDSNKKKIVEYLLANGRKHTADICRNYGGDDKMPAVRKALNELRKEGKVTTDDIVSMWQGKLWWIINPSPANK